MRYGILPTTNSVLQSQNYLFSAPAPPLSIISAPAPAPATSIYCHFKLFYNSSTMLIEVEISFPSSQHLQTDCKKYLLRRLFRLRVQVSHNFGSTGSGSATLMVNSVTGNLLRKFYESTNALYALSVMSYEYITGP